jgi:hypothetical protein
MSISLAILTPFPPLRLSSSARNCWSLSIRSASLYNSFARCSGSELRPQVVLKALRAAETAASTSEAVACATEVIVLPVAGLRTSNVAESEESRWFEGEVGSQ